MSIVVHCPKCQAKLRGPTDMAGKTVRCKGCQERFRVPGGDPAASPSDSQHLSVIEPPPSDYVPKPLAPAGTRANPHPLDDLLLEELPKPAVPLPKREPLDASDLIEEPNGPDAAFSFEDPAPKAGRKKRQDDDAEDEDRPRKRRNGAADEDEPPPKRSYQKKAGAPWAVIIGVGVALLAIGGGVVAIVMTTVKKEEAKAKSDPPPAELKPKGNPKGEEAKATPPNRDDGKPPVGPKSPGGVKPPVEPAPKKGPPPKQEPPPPSAVKLPDPPAGNVAVVGKAKHRIALDVPADKVRDVRVAGVSLTVAFNSQPAFQGAGAKDVIRQYSVATGAKGRQFEIDSTGLTWPRAFAIGAADGLAAVESGGPGKMSAYDFDTGTLLFDNQDAFEGTTGRVPPLAALAVGADRKLFVVDQAGTVDVWDLGTRVRVVTGTPSKRSATGKPAAKACLINSGAAVAVALDGKVWAVNASGAPVGKPVTLPDPTAVPLALGAGAGADRAAVAYALPGGRFGVAAIHPTTGEIEYHTTLPEGSVAPTAISWPADTLLAVSAADGTGFIVDVEERAVTAYLKATTGKVALFPTGGEFWWLTDDAADAKKSTLQSVEMPFDGYFDVSKKAKADQTPVFLVPRPDGLAK